MDNVLYLVGFFIMGIGGFELCPKTSILENHYSL
jgi:hypothetical protein